MSERRKKKKEKQDDWLDALTALHMNVAQSEKADAELRRKKYLNAFIVTLTAAVLVGGSYAGWHFRDFLFAKFQHLEIRLKDDSASLSSAVRTPAMALMRFFTSGRRHKQNTNNR